MIPNADVLIGFSQVSISPEGSPSVAEVKIESTNINFALFDVFFGDAPVSPSLKAMVCNGLAKILI